MKNYLMFFLLVIFQSESSFAMYRGYESSLRNILTWSQGEIVEAKKGKPEDMPLSYKMTAMRLRNGFYSKTGEFPCSPYEFYYNDFLAEGRSDQLFDSPDTVTDPKMSPHNFLRKSSNTLQSGPLEGVKQSAEERTYIAMVKAITVYADNREQDEILPGFHAIRKQFHKDRFANLRKG